MGGVRGGVRGGGGGARFPCCSVQEYGKHSAGTWNYTRIEPLLCSRWIDHSKFQVDRLFKTLPQQLVAPSS